MSDRLRGRVSSGAFAQIDCSLMCQRAGPGAWFGRSNRVVASDGLPKEYRRCGRYRQTADGPGRAGPIAGRPEDCGLFTERWLILPPSGGQTRRRPGPRVSRAPRLRCDPRSRRGYTRGGGSVAVAWSVRSRTLRLGLAASLLGLASLAAAVPVGAADAVTLTTPFPAIAVSPGSNPSFDITVTTAAAGRVDLAVGKVPDGWTAVLRGGGFTIDGVESPGGSTGDQGDPERHRPGRRDRDHATDRRARHDQGWLDDPVGRRPGDAQCRRQRDPDHRYATGQGRLERKLQLQPHADQRHARGPAVQRHRHRARRLDRHRPGRDHRAGRQRRRQGRRDDARSRSPPRPPTGPPPAPIRSRSTPRAGPRPPTPISRSRSPAATA